LTYLNDLDEDLSVVEYKARWNHMQIQEMTQHLIVLERKLLMTNKVVNRHIQCQAGKSADKNTVMTEDSEHFVNTVIFVLMVVISSFFVGMAIHNFTK
jgi:hypothetical protein